MKTFAVIGLVILVVAGGGVFLAAHYVNSAGGVAVRTETIRRGELSTSISATGTLEPEDVVDVGAQVVGRIKDLGIDPSDPQKKKRIDYGSTVHEGTVLAYIDDSVYQAQLDQAKASLVRAEADVQQMIAKQEQALDEWQRAQSLRSVESLSKDNPRSIKAISDADFVLAKANYEVAKANVEVAKAVVEQSKAALNLAKTNLDYTVIKSPVEGVIIARRYNIGQTVVSSLNAPSLFLIAKDLSKMQVWTSVNEADIGRIRVGMPVTFTVDAFADETFKGTVAQIRLNAQTTQNVVTYTVVVSTDNSSGKLGEYWWKMDMRNQGAAISDTSQGKLLPYLTANVQFQLEHRENALMVPQAALGWGPKPEQVDPEIRQQAAASSDSPAEKQPPRIKKVAGAKDDKKPEQKHKSHGRLWTIAGKYVRPLDVRVGISDGAWTEVSGEDLREGVEVVVGDARPQAVADSDVNNPFAPRMFRGGKGKK